MSERVLLITEFAGVSVRTANIKVSEYEDTGDQPVSRIITLPNGVKIDLDGTEDSDMVLGQTIGVFAMRASGRGFDVTNTHYRTVANLKGKHGILKGVQINFAGTETVYVCTARLLIVRPRRYVAGQDVPLGMDYRPTFWAEAVWERKSTWAVGS